MHVASSYLAVACWTMIRGLPGLFWLFVVVWGTAGWQCPAAEGEDKTL
jgi:hypothetical protein